MCLFCPSTPVEPVYGRSGNDLRAFRPHPEYNNRGKIISYSSREYDVYVTTTHSAQWELAKLQAFAQSILNQFRGPAYTYISINVYSKNEPGRAESSPPYRLVKDEGGGVVCTPMSKQEVRSFQGEEDLNKAGYAKIHFVCHFGFKNRLLYNKDKMKMKRLQLDQF